MAPTEASQSQNMSPDGNLVSVRGKCEPYPRNNNNNNNNNNYDTKNQLQQQQQEDEGTHYHQDDNQQLQQQQQQIQQRNHYNHNNNNNNNNTSNGYISLTPSSSTPSSFSTPSSSSSTPFSSSSSSFSSSSSTLIQNNKTSSLNGEAHNVNTTTVTKSNPKKDEDDPDSEEWESKLWSVGCKSACFTVFLYLYGNHMLMGKLPKDPRVDSWLFMQSPTPALLTTLAYIAFCTYLGPLIMKGRQPPQGLKQVMILYNAVQVVFSAWMFYEGGMAGWFGSYSFICQPCDFSNSPQALRMLNVAMWYNLSKFFDFLDTIFFILNKKYSHISLLHVTHHSLMPLGIWYGLRHEAGGQTTFFGFLNCFVHTVMYLYYLLAAMGPKVRPYLWWKKYLTKLQMAQFITMMVHASVSVVSGCQAGAPLMRIILVMAAIFQILFTDFYIKAYLNRTSGKTKKIASPVFCNTLNNFQQQPATPSPISLHKKINSEMKVEEENQGEIRHRCSRVD